MKPFLSCFYLSISFLLFLHGVHGLNFVEKFCEKAARSDSELNHNFCVKALQVALRNNVGNLQGLGLITLGLIKANSSNTMLHIKHLLKDKSSTKKFDENALIDCRDIYSDAVHPLKDAVEYFRSKRYGEANVEISAVMDASVTCEDGFSERRGEVSPLTRMNNDMFQLTLIALIISNIIPS